MPCFEFLALRNSLRQVCNKNSYEIEINFYDTLLCTQLYMIEKDLIFMNLIKKIQLDFDSDIFDSHVVIINCQMEDII